MPALGWHCERKWGATECAGTETYAYEYGGQGTIKCGRTNPHGESFCCIKSGGYAFFEPPDGTSRTRRDPAVDCCSGHWKEEVGGGGMLSSHKPHFALCL
eukprot:Skav212206  [mRNA]  locus=scaffold754:787997:788296:+ [translate_table: standard]